MMTHPSIDSVGSRGPFQLVKDWYPDRLMGAVVFQAMKSWFGAITLVEIPKFDMDVVFQAASVFKQFDWTNQRVFLYLECPHWFT